MADEPLLETVPNISVASDPALVEAHAAALESGGARVADVHADHDHERTVLTAFGTAAQLVPGMVALLELASRTIDLTVQHGVHPRVGAVDVLPIVPLDGLVEDGGTHDDAVAALRQLAAAVDAAEEHLHVPLVRYGLDDDGAPIDGAAFAGQARQGGRPGVSARIDTGELALLAGPHGTHPEAGVTLAGVRDVLVAFNVVLDAAAPLELAREVALAIRESAGGARALPGVRAMGVELASAGEVQVSTNVERWARCGPARVLETVAALAREAGADAVRAELVGLAPRAAIAQLRYSCSRVGTPLQAAPRPTIEDHVQVTRTAL